MAANEAPSTQPDAVAEAPAGIKGKLPLIALIAVGLAVGGGTGAAIIGPMVAEKMGRGVAVADSASSDSSAAGEHAEEEADAEGSAAPTVTLLENLVLNPAGSGGSRFLLLSVAIESGNSKSGADFTARDAELRDIILTALGTKTVDQLTDISARDVIKSEIQTAVTSRFGKGSVKRLYFPQFVVQ